VVVTVSTDGDAPSADEVDAAERQIAEQSK
jgi:hypothetical protein